MVALTAPSPSEVRDPPTHARSRRGAAQSPASIGAGRRRAPPVPLQTLFFPHFACSAFASRHMERPREPPRPRTTPGHGQDLANTDQGRWVRAARSLCPAQSLGLEVGSHQGMGRGRRSWFSRSRAGFAPPRAHTMRKLGGTAFLATVAKRKDAPYAFLCEFQHCEAARSSFQLQSLNLGLGLGPSAKPFPLVPTDLAPRPPAPHLPPGALAGSVPEKQPTAHPPLLLAFE